MFDMRTPVILVNDPKLLKQFTVKDFDHFSDHRVFVDETMDTLFGNSLFCMQGQKWRDMRSTLSPAFTGSKMRHMFSTVLDVTQQMIEHMSKEADKKGDLVQYEMKETCSRLLNDVIAISAFGVSVNSFEDPNNDFYLSGRQLMNILGPLGMIKFFGFRLVPGLMKQLGIQLFDQRARKFFKGIILSTLDNRWKNGIQNNDVIDVLLKVRQGQTVNAEHDEKDTAGFATVQESELGKSKHKRQWTDDELVSQAFLFFLAGFDTSSTLMSFASYEIMLNPEIQERLFEEVRLHHELTNGKLTYENLKDLKYLDMVVSETLRMWSPFPVIDRLCTKTLEFDDGEFKHTFEEGTGLWINAAGIHNNPKYYPEPRKFDPERFNEENKRLISPDTFLAFGSGPRACIGSRFALMEVKVMLFYLVLNFELVAIEKTQIPLQLKKTIGALMAKEGIWTGLRKREVKSV